MSRASRIAEQALAGVPPLIATGRLAEAELACHRILAAAPGQADAMQHLALIALRQGQEETANDWLNRALRQKPGSAAIYLTNCALTLLALGHPGPALEAARAALARRAEYPEALQAEGHALADLGDIDAAIAAYERAARLKPALHDIQNNVGLALSAASRLDEAEPWFARAVAREPRDALLRANHAGLLKDLGRLDGAEAGYRAALALTAPGTPEAALVRYNLGILLLLAGRLPEGFSEYEFRFAAGVARVQSVASPRWNGEALPEKSLLVFAEQGHGDTIHMARFLPLLAGGGTRVLLRAGAPLARLLAGLPGVSLATADTAPADRHIPIMSLPHVLGTTLETIPAAPYLSADPAAVASWRARVEKLPGRRVGLAWAGNPADRDLDRRRSIPLARLAPLGSVPGVSFVSLQKDLPPGHDPAAFGAKLHDWTGEITDFADTAALIMALDLVITVDTAVAHLAGALGKPVWVLNRAHTDWRWLLGRDDSPWYPSLRQFRQPTPGDWDSAIAAARAALAAP